MKKTTKKEKEVKTISKENILNILNTQKVLTKKPARQEIVDIMIKLVNHHIKDNAQVIGLSSTRSKSGLNLGELFEIIVKSKYRNKLVKDNKEYDATIKGERNEVKFATTDSYAHALNRDNSVDCFIIGTYSKKQGAKIYKIPADKINDIAVCHTWDKENEKWIDRPTTNQKPQYLDKKMTQEIFGVVGL